MMNRLLQILCVLGVSATLNCAPPPANDSASPRSAVQKPPMGAPAPEPAGIDRPVESVASEASGQAQAPPRMGYDASRGVSFEIRTMGDDWAEGIPRYREQVKVFADGSEVRHGEHIAYWENGQEKLKMYYVDDLPHGRKSTWHNDGSKWSEGEFIHGKEHGTWVIWDSSGLKQQEFHMDHGALHGMQTFWYPDGQMRRQGRWHHGRQVGTFTTWDQAGKIVGLIDYGPVPEDVTDP